MLIVACPDGLHVNVCMHTEHLLGQLGHGESSVLLGSSGGQRSESDHEEVKSGEGDQIDG
eukprot:gene13851-biopygen16704